MSTGRWRASTTGDWGSSWAPRAGEHGWTELQRLVAGFQVEEAHVGCVDIAWGQLPL